jgi:hypothetical protein
MEIAAVPAFFGAFWESGAILKECKITHKMKRMNIAQVAILRRRS